MSEKLQEVIQNLESLTKKILEKSSPVSLVKRIFEYARGCFFEEKPSRDLLQRSIHQVLDSVSTILPLIKDFQGGDADQRKLAARIIEGIKEYNKLVDLLSVPQHINDASLMLNRKIELPRSPLTSSTNFSPDQRKMNGAVQSIFVENLELHKFSVHEEDLFRMKAISLLKESIGLKPAISAVRNAPIQKLWDDVQVSQDFVHARQTVCTFPGEVRVLTGVFQCKNGGAFGKLIDVKCTLSVYQTGFPAPSQYTGGITLSKAFVNQEELKVKQQILAAALLPEGKYYQKAKEWIQKRKEAFNLNKDKLILTLKEHSSAIVEAGNNRSLNEEEKAVIDNFFNTYTDYDSISEVHYWISQRLMEVDDRYREKLHLFNAFTANYLSLIYPLLSGSLERILKEKSPTGFDQALIAMAIFQQDSFFADFENEIAIDVVKVAASMHANLNYEISLFGSNIHL
ncbi:MAG: hypothetical protein WC222_08535 [Parachlamydiales bacterium]